MKKIFSLWMIVGCLFAFTWQTKALTYTVTVPDGTQACFVTGTMDGWSGPSVKNRMAKVDGVANQFTIDIPNATETDAYKYYCGPDWGYEELNADGGKAGDRSYTASDVVANWTKDFVLDERTVSIQALVPSAVQVLYITGQFNGWSGDFANSPYKMTLDSEDADGKVFSIDNISYLDVINMQFKFLAGPDWTYQQTSANDGTTSDGNFIYGTTEKTAYFDVKFFQAIFNPTQAGDITVKATVPAGTDKVWIQGSFAGWTWDNPDPLEMTKQDDGTFTYTVKNVQAFSYKLYNWPDWSYCEYAEGNPSSDVPDRAATFDPDATTINVSVFGWRQDAPAAIPQVSADKFNTYSVGRQIVVEGASSQVDIFNIAGQMIQSVKTSGAFTSKSLPAGVYIVRVDGVSQKLIVK